MKFTKEDGTRAWINPSRIDCFEEVELADGTPGVRIQTYGKTLLSISTFDEFIEQVQDKEKQKEKQKEK